MADDGENKNMDRVEELNKKMERILSLLEEKGGSALVSSQDSAQEQKKIHDEDFRALKQEIFEVHDEKNRQIHVKIDEVSDRLKNKIDSVLTEARKETRDQVSTQITFFLNAFKITGTILSFFVLVLGIWGFKTFTDIRERSVNEAVEIMKKQSPELKYEQAMDKLYKQGLVDSILLRIARKEMSRSSAIDIDGVEVDELLAIVKDFTTEKKRDYKEEKLFSLSLLALSNIYKDKDPITKKRICESIFSDISGNKSVEWLNDNEEIVVSIIEFLGYMEYTKPAKDIESLLEKKDLRDPIKDAAVFYVGLVGYEGSYRDLVSIYNSKDSNETRREKALWVLSKIHPEYIKENALKKLMANNNVLNNLNNLVIIVSGVVEGNPKYKKQSRIYKGEKVEDNKLRKELLLEIMGEFVQQCKPDFEFKKVDTDIKIIADSDSDNERSFLVPINFITYPNSDEIIKLLLERFIQVDERINFVKLLKIMDCCGFDNVDVKMVGDSEIRCYTNMNKWQKGEEVTLKPGSVEDDTITINFSTSEKQLYIPYSNYLYVTWWIKGAKKMQRGIIPINEDFTIDGHFFSRSNMFRSTDATDYLMIAVKLQNHEDKTQKIIYDLLDDESKIVINELKAGDHLKEKQKKTLGAGLNKLLRRDDLAAVIKIDRSKLPEDDQALFMKSKGELTERQFCKRNRLVMESIYGEDIAESKSYEIYVPPIE